MTFREVVDFLNHEDRETVFSPDDPTIMSTLEALIGKAYRFTRSYKTPRDAMRWVLWTLFYFVQQERALSDKDEDVVLEAVQAARENAVFCNGREEVR